MFENLYDIHNAINSFIRENNNKRPNVLYISHDNRQKFLEMIIDSSGQHISYSKIKILNYNCIEVFGLSVRYSYNFNGVDFLEELEKPITEKDQISYNKQYKFFTDYMLPKTTLSVAKKPKQKKNRKIVL